MLPSLTLLCCIMRLEHSHALKSLPLLKCCWQHSCLQLNEIMQFLDVCTRRIKKGQQLETVHKTEVHAKFNHKM